MQVCGNCGHTNRPGVLFCENCGTSLTGKAAVGTTKSFEEENAPVSAREPIISAGTDYFLPDSSLRIEIEGGPEPILVKPKQELIFGRRDPATGAMPDIDLTPYAGYRMGVSRRHAAIRAADENHLDVWDLGSSNGTFLNGQRLNAHRPYRLRDGDRLRLGQMVIRILFQPPIGEESVPAAQPVEQIDADESRPPAEGGQPTPGPAAGAGTAGEAAPVVKPAATLVSLPVETTSPPPAPAAGAGTAGEAAPVKPAAAPAKTVSPPPAPAAGAGTAGAVKPAPDVLPSQDATKTEPVKQVPPSPPPAADAAGEKPSEPSDPAS